MIGSGDRHKKVNGAVPRTLEDVGGPAIATLANFVVDPGQPGPERA